MAVIEEETGIPTRSNGVSHVLAVNCQGGRGGPRASQNRRNPSQQVQQSGAAHVDGRNNDQEVNSGPREGVCKSG